MRKTAIKGLLVLMTLGIAMNCIVLAEEDNTGTVVSVSEISKENEIVSLPEDGKAISYGQNPIASSHTVFGEDDRIKINTVKDYPYVAVAYMDVHHKCGCSSTSTGFMVSPNKLMTAAHCIICTKHQKWADRITFYFGYKNKKNYAYKYNGKWYAFVGNTFPDGYTTDNDWAVVKLYKNVGKTVGWFGLIYSIPDSAIKKMPIMLLGYRNGEMKLSAGYTSPRSDTILSYEMDTEPGNSGGPLFYLDGDDPYALAINIAYNDYYNSGYRITDVVFHYLQELDNY